MSKLIATLSLSLLLVAINALATLAQGVPPAVLDTAGGPLRTGTRYYIIRRSAPGINGPGLTLLRPINASCPLYVGLQGKTTGSSNGLPVTFLPFVSDETIIREASDFSVSFVASTTCPQFSTDWAIDQASDPNMTGRTLITTRRENQPSDFFRILRDGRDTYKLHYCPTDVCPQCSLRCGDAGLDGRFLALHVPALPVVFQRA